MNNSFPDRIKKFNFDMKSYFESGGKHSPLTRLNFQRKSPVGMSSKLRPSAASIIQ